MPVIEMNNALKKLNLETNYLSGKKPITCRRYNLFYILLLSKIGPL